MSEIPEIDAEERGGRFDPKRFFELARKVGHGRALGIEYRAENERLGLEQDIAHISRKAPTFVPQAGRERAGPRHTLLAAEVWRIGLRRACVTR